MIGLMVLVVALGIKRRLAARLRQCSELQLLVVGVMVGAIIVTGMMLHMTVIEMHLKLL